MGLINLFNAMTLRPHIPYRFKAEIWPNYQNAYDNNDKIFRPLEFTIKRISQPVFKLDTENKLNFGNTVFVVPILKFGDTTMEITFEETDDMRVFKTLSGLMGSELFKGVNGGLLNIRITQFDETMLTISDKKTYICRLKEYGTPSFNNNGHGSPIEISATFKVVYVVEEPTVLEEIKDGYRVIIREKLPENERIINEAQTVADEEDKQKMSKGDFDKKMRDRKIMDVLKAEQIKTSAGVAEQAMIAMGYDPTKESQVKMFDAELKMRNINLDDGLNNAELKTLTQMVKDYVDPQYATEDLLSNLNENINALEKLNDEYNSYLTETTKQPEAKLPKNIGSIIREGDPVRYREGAKTNAAAGVDNLESTMKSGKITDANGNQITSTKELKSHDKYFVDGHQYKAVLYDGKWSLNSDVAGNDFAYERAATNPEEVFQNVLAAGPVKYNLGGKSDGNIKDGLDCMGFVGIVMQATGSDVVDADGNKLNYKNVKSVFSNYNTANFFDKDFKVVVPPGTDMKVFVAKEGKNSGHIYVEHNGYIYESAGGKGVVKTEKSKWKDKGLKYKNVTASEEQVTQFYRNSKNKTS